MLPTSHGAIGIQLAVTLLYPGITNPRFQPSDLLQDIPALRLAPPWCCLRAGNSTGEDAVGGGPGSFQAGESPKDGRNGALMGF